MTDHLDDFSRARSIGPACVEWAEDAAAPDAVVAPSPTPWEYYVTDYGDCRIKSSVNGEIVTDPFFTDGIEKTEANAKLIVQAVNASQWRPMHTAPRQRLDGVLQQVLLIGFYPSNGHYTDIVQAWWVDGTPIGEHGGWARWRHEFPPAAWMPSPPPPPNPVVPHPGDDLGKGGKS